MFSRIAAARGRTVVCTLIVTSLSPGQIVTGLGATSLCIAGGTISNLPSNLPSNVQLTLVRTR